MRKQLLRFALSFLITVSAVAAPPVGVSGMFTTARSSGDNRLLEEPVPVDLAISSGAGFAVSGDVELSRRFAVELRHDRVSPDVSLRAGGFSLNAGSLDMALTSLSVLVNFAPDSRLQPYAGVGAVYATFGDIDAPLIGSVIGDDELTLDPEFGASLAAGLRGRLTDRISLFGDLRYFPVEVAIERSDSFPVDVDLNPLVIAVGVRVGVR
jgi:opacity protein-like surface antigen